MVDTTAHGTEHEATQGFDVLAFVADPAFWALVGLLAFLGLLIWKNVPAVVLKSLDDRADKIKAELESAQALRAEAEAKLVSVQQRQLEAEREAKEIVEAARREAEALTATAAASLAERLARRERLAEERIARAEADALREVRTAAIEAASKASADLLAEQTAGAGAQSALSAGIEDIRKALSR
jgi:F-type H+-transporting ATPase subunit b